MFLGFDDSLKAIKKELKGLGADTGLLRDWQKSYDKVRKQSPILENKYEQVRSELEQVQKLLEELEQLLSGGELAKAMEQSAVREQLALCSKQMKQYQDHFTQELLIGKEDREFHLTYSTLIRLCGQKKQEGKDLLILQSEVENLLAIIKEALEKGKPDFRALAYFYLGHEERELVELPHQEKLALIETIYEREFIRPIHQLLSSCMAEDRIREIMEVDLWNY